MQNRPLIFALLTYIIGIVLSDLYLDQLSKIPLWLCIVLCAATLIPLHFLKGQSQFRSCSVSGFLYCVPFILLSCIRVFQLSEIKQTDHFSRFDSSYLITTIKEPPDVRERTVKAELRILKSVDSNGISAKSGSMIAYFEVDTNSKQLVYGDMLLISGKAQKVDPPKNPDEFDYQAFLKKKQIHHTIYLNSRSWTKLNQQHCSYIRNKAYLLRNHLLEELKRFDLSQDEFGVAAAILLGYSDDLDQDLRTAYQQTGAMHILCVSGLHVGLFAMVIIKLLFFLDKKSWKLKLKAFIVCLAIWLYAAVTGFSPSVMRAACMFTFVSIGQCLNKNTSIYNSLATSALVLLFYNPFMLYNLGFQLSYIAVIGIVMFQEKFKKLYHPKNKITKYIWDLVCVSLAAQLVTCPLSLYYFHIFPNYFLLSNIIASPLSVVIIPLGMALLASLYIHQSIAALFAFLLKKSLLFMNEGILFIQSLPFSYSKNICISDFEQIIFYISIFIFCYALNKRSKKAVFVVISGLIIAFSSIFTRKINQISQENLTVYNITKHNAIEYFYGTKSVIYVDSVLLHNINKLDFPTANHRIKRGTKQSEIRLIPSNTEMVKIRKPFEKEIQIKDRNKIRPATL